MTLDEAIAHCLEVAEENDLAAGTYELLAENNHNAYEKLTAETNSSRCAECAADHRQLAEWLQDYKMLRGEYDNCQLNSIEDYRRETGLICTDDAEVIVTPYRSAGAAIAFDVCGRGQVLRDIVRIRQTEEELIFIDSEGRENHIAKKLIDTMEVIT